MVHVFVAEFCYSVNSRGDAHPMVNIRDIRVGTVGPSYERLLKEAAAAADEFIKNNESGNFNDDFVCNELPCRDPEVMKHFDFERPYAVDYGEDQEAYERDRKVYDDTYRDHIDRAREACFQCPVRTKCLAASLSSPVTIGNSDSKMHPEPSMVWGGYAPKARVSYIYPQFLEELRSRGKDVSEFQNKNR